MQVLVIIDNDCDIDGIISTVKNQPQHLHLFPLTSNCITINHLIERLKALDKVNMTILESAKLINAEVEQIQKNIHNWSANLGNTVVGKKNLKEWFLLPDHSGSAWWFSLISEKNSVQDDVFFKLAQINAVYSLLQQEKYDACCISMTDKRQAKILTALVKNVVHDSHYLPSQTVTKNLKTKIFNFMHKSGFFGATVAAVLHLLIWLKDAMWAKLYLPSLQKRLQTKNPFMFISYFPNIDSEAAKQGIFKNKYALPLQEKLQNENISITWLLMPVFYDGHHFKSAMQLANLFANNNEHIFVLQEFFKLKVAGLSILWWLRQTLLSLFLYPLLNKKKLLQGISQPEALPLFKYLWWHSFVGTSSIRGIIFYLTYRQMFKVMPHIKQCLYYSEMQAWEKALLMAKKQQKLPTQMLAFQHTVVVRNFFNYFYAQEETQQYNKITDMPVPDVFIANGKHTYALLQESQFPYVCQAEAIRHMYLNNMTAMTVSAKKSVLLVVGSYDKTETKSLISMVYSAYPHAQEFAIWIKGSPVNPVEPILAELGIARSASHLQIQHQAISELLPATSIAIVANTTVAIEAYACGCAVVVPVLADTMLMNPIVDTQAKYFLASNAQELKQAVKQHFAMQALPPIENFIQHYWNLDPTIPLWTKLLLPS